MLPTLRLSLIRTGSLLRVPFFWTLMNVFILLALVTLSLSSNLAWWVCILMALSMFSLLHQEEWVHYKPSGPLVYRQGLRGWSKERTFPQSALEAVVICQVGRYFTLCLQAEGREWEIERSLREASLLELKAKLEEHWLGR